MDQNNKFRELEINKLESKIEKLEKQCFYAFSYEKNNYTKKISELKNKIDMLKNNYEKQNKYDFFSSNEKNKQFDFSEESEKKNEVITDSFLSNKQNQVNFFETTNASKDLLLDKVKDNANDTMIDTILINCEKIIKCLNDKGFYSKRINELELKISDYKNKIQKAKMEDAFWKVVVVGSFSCGKSSFINSIIGEELEPVDITPVNHANSIFTYGKIQTIKSEDRYFSKNEYINEVKKINGDYKEFLIEYPCEILKNIKLYDTPGFGSVNIETSNTEISDIELSKDAAKNADTIFYLVDITNGTIDKSSLKYLEEIERNKNIYIILTHSDKKSPKARETIKEDIARQVENIGIDKDSIFLYSSIKEKYETDSVFSFNRGCIMTLLNGFFRKNKKAKTESLSKTDIISLCSDLKKIIEKYMTEDINDFVPKRREEILSMYIYNSNSLFERFMNQNPEFIIDNKNIFTYKLHLGDYSTLFKDTYTIHVYEYKILDNNFFQYYHGMANVARLIAQLFCIPRFNEYKAKGIFSEWTFTETGAREEIDKIASIMQEDFKKNHQYVKNQFLIWCKFHENWDEKVKTQVVKEASERWSEIEEYKNAIDKYLN